MTVGGGGYESVVVRTDAELALDHRRNDLGLVFELCRWAGQR